MAYLIGRMHYLRALFSRSYLARFVAIVAVHASIVELSLFLVPPNLPGASLVWPPSAVGLAFLWFWGLEMWPALVGAFFAVLLANGISPPLVATTALGNALEALIGAFILRYYLDFDPMLWRLRDALGLIVAAFLAALASATIISLGVGLILHDGTPSSVLWLGLWIGHTVSIITFGPFALRWFHKPYFTRTRNEWIEGMIGFGVLIALSFLMSWTPYTTIGGIPLLYVAVMVLIWVALRTGPRGIAFALLVFALILSTGVLYGHALQSPSADPRQILFGVQMIIGVLSLIFLLFTSITEERKEAVIALEAHVGQLEGALQKISSEDQAKTDFIAILAHELRNPLSPIVSALELIKHNGIEPENEKLVTSIASHVHTMARLLDDLLDISRISLKRLKLQKEPVEIRSVFERALEMVHPQIEARGHRLAVELPQEEIWLHGDPVRLGQIFVNLLNNAAKYTEQGGALSLKAKRDGPTLVVEVRDSGIGISPDRLSAIFEPFGGDTPARGSAGLRIGLSLAKRMAQMHHGTLEAHSAGEGKGSQFVVRLPLPTNMPLPLHENPKRVRSRFSRETLARSAARDERLKILVVDDNEAAAQNLGRLLELGGHTTAIAYDAPQALALARRLEPHVALLDIGLPSMDGYQLAKELQVLLPQIQLVAITGFGQAEDRQRAREAGFEEHMVKPVSIVDVERVLGELRNGDTS